MSTIKLARADDWPGLQGRVPVEVKISSRGFLSGDSSKIASEVGDRFIHEVRKIEDELDQTNHKFAHVVSCGCTELFGANRNADGWSKEALAKDMHTYLDHAKCYRDHHNSRDADYYGTPKVAMFDNDRGYGRLLVAYHAKESACKDRRAKVANREIEELERKGEVKVSHGTKISFDTCSICGNEAAKRSQYCDSQENGGKCPLFGCKSGLSKIADDGRVQFVHNDDSNIFYDISAIGLSKHSAKQADRVAYATLFDQFDKTAASHDGAVRGSAWLAEQLALDARRDLIDLRGLSPYQSKMAKVASHLASLSPGDPRLLIDDYNRDVAHLWCLNSPNIATRKAAVEELTRRQEFVGPRTYAKICQADEATADRVAHICYGGLQRLADDSMLASFVKTCAFTNDATPPGLLPTHAAITADSVRPDVISRRAKFAAMEDAYVAETPSKDSKAALIALEYMAFKVAYASRILDQSRSDVGFLA